MPKYFLIFIVTVLIFSIQLSYADELNRDTIPIGKRALLFVPEGGKSADTIQIFLGMNQIPAGYFAYLNMAVCDDKLCANVLLKIWWDLAGNYVQFDTLPGKPFTKFDHKPFTGADYNKLDKILKDKNSALRLLEKEELTDKNNLVRATTVDAVTGATPATIKEAVVEGAVYTSYSLWHYVYGTVKDSICAYTGKIYTADIVRELLGSANYDTQLFALKQFSGKDYITYFTELCTAVRHGVPLIKGYIIGKLPLPFRDQEQNKKLVSLFPDLDSYSKSIWIERITSEEKPAKVFLPLMAVYLKQMEKKQSDQIISAGKKYEIAGYSDAK